MTKKISQPDWFLFEIPTASILRFLEKQSGRPFRHRPPPKPRTKKWQLAVRRVLRRRLHLDLGIPGIYAPESPIVENKDVLHAAVLLGLPSIQVILSGEWEVAALEGLITRRQLRRHERLLDRSNMEEAV